MQMEKKAGAVTKDKKVHYIMTKGSVQQEDKTFVKIYVPNIGRPKYIKQILTEINGEIDNSTIVVGDLAHLHQMLDHPDRKLIRKHSS